MSTTVALVTGFVFTLVAGLLVWRGTRRLSTSGDTETITVSRQWLMNHQSDDRS